MSIITFETYTAIGRDIHSGCRSSISDETECSMKRTNPMSSVQAFPHYFFGDALRRHNHGVRGWLPYKSNGHGISSSVAQTTALPVCCISF